MLQISCSYSIYFPPPAGAGLIAVFAPLRRPLRAAKPPSAAKPNTAGPKSRDTQRAFKGDVNQST